MIPILQHDWGQQAFSTELAHFKPCWCGGLRFCKLSIMERHSCVITIPTQISYILTIGSKVLEPCGSSDSLSLLCFQWLSRVLSKAKTRTNYQIGYMCPPHSLTNTSSAQELKAKNSEWSWKALLWVQKFPALCLPKVGHPGTPSATQIYFARCSHIHLITFLNNSKQRNRLYRCQEELATFPWRFNALMPFVVLLWFLPQSYVTEVLFQWYKQLSSFTDYKLLLFSTRFGSCILGLDDVDQNYI